MIKDNYDIIETRVRKAAAAAGRSGDEITVLSVSKSQPLEKLKEAAEAGLTLFGESRLQEALPKILAVKEINSAIQFHFIGPFQTNKAKKIVEHFSMIQSIDRIAAAEAVDKAAKIFDKTQDILVELNLAEEPQKSGLKENELENFMEAAARFKNIRIKGFMIIPPVCEDPESNMPYFRKAKNIYDKYGKDGNFPIDTLSMGMSGDFETAVAAGSTMVRVGTAIFSSRP